MLFCNLPSDNKWIVSMINDFQRRGTLCHKYALNKSMTHSHWWAFWCSAVKAMKPMKITNNHSRERPNVLRYKVNNRFKPNTISRLISCPVGSAPNPTSPGFLRYSWMVKNNYHATLHLLNKIVKLSSFFIRCYYLFFFRTGTFWVDGAIYRYVMCI